ncbi:MAG: hypothetical protein WBM70_09040 [Sulfurovum sp.]|jgi:hypothetical protein|uniref:hypothetical protein n=1 Tax=Sulfurovum sp. TaxID=1969726 RepID=UPI003C770167
MKVLLLWLPLALLAEAEIQSCKAAIMKKSRIHPIAHEEIKQEIEINLDIIDRCQNYPDVIKEAELYNEYLLFKYLKLPTVRVNEDDLLERCRRINYQ